MVIILVALRFGTYFCIFLYKVGMLIDYLN
jgi:hypothetical protein